jgi:hypothetical protein
VTKNGLKGLQAMITVNQQRTYLGTHNNLTQVERIYDVANIQNKCFQARVNYDYTKAELLAILFEKSLVWIRHQYCHLKETLAGGSGGKQAK